MSKTDRILSYETPPPKRIPAWGMMLMGSGVGLMALCGLIVMYELSTVDAYWPAALICGPLLALVLITSSYGLAGLLAVVLGVPVQYGIYALLLRRGGKAILLVSGFHFGGGMIAYLYLLLQ